MFEAPVIHIGNDTQSITAFNIAMLDLLNTQAGDAVKIAAINALAAKYHVSNVSLSNCNIDVDRRTYTPQELNEASSNT